MSRTEPAATPLGDAFHVFDTTLRDGAQREGISYSVADKLAVARHLDALGVGLHRGWLARRAAQGHRVLRPRRGGGAGAAARRAGRVRRHPQGGHVGRRGPAGAGVARQPGAGRHARREVRPAAHRAGAAHRRGRELRDGRRHGRVPPRRGPSGVPRRRALLRRLRLRPRHRAARARRGGRRRAPTSPCSATPTAACCRWASPRSSRRWPRAPASGSASTARTTRAARSPTRWPRYRRARRTSSAPRTVTANGRATPTCSPSWGIS